ncbi:hypothetical protein CEUSTIGMA_g7434.t1 [Chlamydomonas eustigma]|uniref:Uncharacterized protein n=1 Tax=Chlamydomonas eustigma TaxID=1157962 RepID=A0A250XAA2_9CHLO|nr:hypothetical protein CEUSTIGMA_g7434.t1 [Chlamydomonas eustigma]|eukprot:GAX79994.1 hypothetical protein CEUSTIGMA_g7434.t1 [Chlamydomonas eustigma]
MSYLATQKQTFYDIVMSRSNTAPMSDKNNKRAFHIQQHEIKVHQSEIQTRAAKARPVYIRFCQENQCPQDLTILEDPVKLAKWYMRHLRNANKRNLRAGGNQQIPQNNLDPGAGPQQGPPLHPLGDEGAMPLQARPAQDQVVSAGRSFQQMEAVQA